MRQHLSSFSLIFDSSAEIPFKVFVTIYPRFSPTLESSAQLLSFFCQLLCSLFTLFPFLSNTPFNFSRNISAFYQRFLIPQHNSFNFFASIYAFYSTVLDTWTHFLLNLRQYLCSLFTHFASFSTIPFNFFGNIYAFIQPLFMPPLNSPLFFCSTVIILIQLYSIL